MKRCPELSTKGTIISLKLVRVLQTIFHHFNRTFSYHQMQNKLLVTFTSHSELFSCTFFEIIWSDYFAELTEMQTGQGKAEAIKRN